MSSDPSPLPAQRTLQILEELRQQVAVRAVQFHALEAGALGAAGGGDEVLHEVYG